MFEIASMAKLCNTTYFLFSSLPCCVLILSCTLSCQRVPVSVPSSPCVCVTLSIRLARTTFYCLDGAVVPIWVCIFAVPMRSCSCDFVLFTHVAARTRISRSALGPLPFRASVGEDDVVVLKKTRAGVCRVWKPSVRIFRDGAVDKSNRVQYRIMPGERPEGRLAELECGSNGAAVGRCTDDRWRHYEVHPVYIHRNTAIACRVLGFKVWRVISRRCFSRSPKEVC